MNEIDALDFLVDTAFVVGSNLDFKLNTESDILKVNQECIPILEEKLQLNGEEIVIDDGFKSIFDTIISDPRAPIILGLLNTIFRKSNSPISNFISKVERPKRSIYYTPKEEVIKLINEIIQISKEPPFVEEKLALMIAKSMPSTPVLHRSSLSSTPSTPSNPSNDVMNRIVSAFGGSK